MHIPDGYLTLPVSIAAFVITAIFWVISARKVKLTEHQVPMMGLLTALFLPPCLPTTPSYLAQQPTC